MCRPSTRCSVWPKKHSLIVGMQKLTLLREENVPCLGNCLTSKSAPTSKSTTSTKSESFSCEINLENKWIWLAFQSEYVVVNLGRIVHLEPTLESLNPWFYCQSSWTFLGVFHRTASCENVWGGILLEGRLGHAQMCKYLEDSGIPQTFWEIPTEGEDEDSGKNAKNWFNKII